MKLNILRILAAVFLASTASADNGLILPACQVNATCLSFVTPGVTVGQAGVNYPDGSTQHTAAAGGPPSGAAGGSLTGTYPNPTLGTQTTPLSFTGSAGTITTQSSVTAGAFFGDASHLSNVTASAVPASGVTAGALSTNVTISTSNILPGFNTSGELVTLDGNNALNLIGQINATTATLTGNAFSVGGTSFTVSAGLVSVGPIVNISSVGFAVGTSTPSFPVDVYSNSASHLARGHYVGDGVLSGDVIEGYFSSNPNATLGPNLKFVSGRGSYNAPTALGAGDELGGFSWFGYNGAASVSAASIRPFANELGNGWNPSANGTLIKLAFSPSGQNTLQGSFLQLQSTIANAGNAPASVDMILAYQGRLSQGTSNFDVRFSSGGDVALIGSVSTGTFTLKGGSGTGTVPLSIPLNAPTGSFSMDSSGNIGGISSMTTSAYFGDGSHLTGVATPSIDNAFTAGQTFESTVTIQGASFSIAGSTLVVTGGYTGIGTSTPSFVLDVFGAKGNDPMIRTVGNVVPEGMQIEGYSANNTGGANGPIIKGFYARGTQNVPTAVQVNDIGMAVTNRFHNGTNFTAASNGSAFFFASENQNPAAQGTAFEILLTPAGQSLKNANLLWASSGPTTAQFNGLHLRGAGTDAGFVEEVNTLTLDIINSSTGTLRMHNAVFGAGGTIPMTFSYAAPTNSLTMNTTGQIGINNFAASTALSIYGVETSSTTQGSVVCDAGTPTLNATATDSHGTYTAGTSATNCTYTFGTAWPKTPDCICGDNSSVLAIKATSTINSVKCTAAVTMSGDSITYLCFGAP